jgi:hypothetical protein
MVEYRKYTATFHVGRGCTAMPSHAHISATAGARRMLTTSAWLGAYATNL